MIEIIIATVVILVFVNFSIGLVNEHIKYYADDVKKAMLVALAEQKCYCKKNDTKKR